MAPILNSMFLPAVPLGDPYPHHAGAGVAMTASDFMPIKYIVDGCAPASSGVLRPRPSSGTVVGVRTHRVAVWWGTTTLRKENA